MGICMSCKTRVTVECIGAQYVTFNSNGAARKEPVFEERSMESPIDLESLGVVVIAHSIGFQKDRIAIVDLDEKSESYCKILSWICLNDFGEEPGRMNWATSAPDRQQIQKVSRECLLVPCMSSNRIYVISIQNRNITISKIIESSSLLEKNLTFPYAVHPVPIKGAPVPISTMGDKDKWGKGDFLFLDGKSYGIRDCSNGSRNEVSCFGGDFAVQMRQNVMISGEWGHPSQFVHGFHQSDIEQVSESYGSRVHVWQFSPQEFKQSVELGASEGALITAVRFLHNPECNHAFACSALGSSIFHLSMNSLTLKWSAQLAHTFSPVQVENWISSEMPGFLSDMVISMDDRYGDFPSLFEYSFRWLYVCSWLHGTIWRLSISDPFRINIHSKFDIGGLLISSTDIIISNKSFIRHLPSSVGVTVFRGGPAQLQLSIDGRRLYLSNSCYKAWDAQFYPDVVSAGGQIIRIDVTSTTMKLNEAFLIDMKDVEGGPFVLRDLHFMNGDCTSDSFL